MKAIYTILLSSLLLLFGKQLNAQALFIQSNAYVYVDTSSGTPLLPEPSTPNLYINGNVVNNGVLENRGEIQFRGNFANNGTFTADGDEVFNGTGTQALNGNFTGANAFNNLLIDKPYQTFLDGNTHIETNSNGALKFIGGGILRMNGTNVMRVLNGAATSIQGHETPNMFGTYSNDKYVIGRLARHVAVPTITREFPIGDDFTTGEGYNPLIVAVNSLSAPDNIVARFQKGSPGTISTGGPFPLSCVSPPSANYSGFTGEGYWEVNQTGTSTVNYDVIAYSNINNVNSAPTADYYRLLRNSSVGGAWPLTAVTDGDECVTSAIYNMVTGANYTGFSFFAIAPSLTSTVTWLGGGTSDWHTGSNWSSGTVPTCATNITIPAGNTPYPVINAPASCGNITLGNAVTLTTNADLQVCGNWVAGTSTVYVTGAGGFVIFQGSTPQTYSGNTQFDRVRLNNANGLALQPGSWFDVFNELALQAGSFNATAGTARLLSTGTNHCAVINDFSPGYTGTYVGTIRAQRAIGGVGNNQHQMGLPVSALLGQMGAGSSSGYLIPTPTCDETQSAPGSPYGNVFRWDEHIPTTCILQGWHVMNSTAPNEHGRGYSSYQIGGSVLEVVGPPNLNPLYQKSGLGNSNYYLPTLQSTISYGFNSGWHLLANPYPSGYIYTSQPGFGIVASVYVPIGPFSGTYQPLNPGDQLAPFQGFMLHNPNVGVPSTYTFSNPNRVASGSQIFYQNSYPEALEIEVSGNGFKDKTELRFDATATPAYDAATDLRKQRSNLGQPSVFTGTGTDLFRIDVRPHTTTVPLGLMPGNNGNFTFEVKGVQSFDPTTYIHLEDKVTNTWQNLRANNIYSFAMNKTESPHRFVLHFTPPAVINTLDATCDDNGTITIEQPGPAQWQYTVTNSGSTLVGSGSVNENSPVTLSVPEGVYTLTLTDANGYQVVKNIHVNGASPIYAQMQVSANGNTVAPGNDVVVEEGQTVVFQCTNSDATQITWHTGDGSVFNQQAVVSYQYADEGVYTATLTVTNADGCTDFKDQNVVVTPKLITGPTSLFTNASVNMYPNPNSGDLLHVELKGMDNAKLRITNALGEIVRKASLQKGINPIDLQQLAAGVYMAEVTNGKWKYTERIVIVQ
ncbi:MAG: T9SS type A sorting domain-containing protein [Chitinophagales bacterium]|nr:T9SS type A sorting domain-containing protein [Chitinophagales bacterium]